MAPAEQVLLSGPPGVGKTTTGHLLAAKLKLPFLDLDEDVRAHTGHTPAEFLRERGEPEFRRIELEVFRQLPRTPAVVALGGGTLIGFESRREARERGVVVGLECSPEELLLRLGRDATERPLLDGAGERLGRLREILEARASSYRAVDLTVSAEGSAAASAEALARLTAALKLRLCRLGSRQSRVLLGEGLSRAAVGAAANLAPSRTIVILSDAGAPARLKSGYIDALSASYQVWHRELPGGESCKSWAALEDVTEEALAHGAGRQSVVVGIGGGAVLDLAGLVASLLGRGAPLILVPTTVLAQVDASIGGKCAINARVGRNLVGAFHPASDVIVDLEFLGSLPPEEYRSGIVEVLKMGLISDEALFRDVAARGAVDLDSVTRAIELKCMVVERDPWESGDRMLLNLGHTLGHALETASGYTIRHGTAVARGIAAVVEFSRLHAGLSGPEADEVLRGIAPFMPSPAPTGEVWAQAMALLRQDKKGNKDAVELIVLPKIGGAARRRVSWTEVEGAWMPFGGSSK